MVMEDTLGIISTCLSGNVGQLADDRLFYGQPDQARETGTRFHRPDYLTLAENAHIMPEICCVTQGACRFMWDGRFFRFRAGDVVMIPRMVPHFEKCLDRETGYSTIWIGFTSTTRAWISRAGYGKGRYTIYDTVHMPVTAAWYKRFIRIGPDEPGTGKRVRTDLQAFFRYLLQQLQAGAFFLNRLSGRERSWRSRSLEKARQFINDHLTDKLTLARIAASIRISPAYLSTLFKKEYGDTVFEYIIWQRLKKAIILLKETDLTITEIAHQLHYRDIYYFSRIFKRNYGISPTSFRNKYV